MVAPAEAQPELRARRRKQGRLSGGSIPVLLTLVGLALVGLAVAPIRSSPGDATVFLPNQLAAVRDDELLEHHPIVPQQARLQGGGASTPTTRKEPVRAPVPVDAQPVSRLAAVPGATSGTVAQVAGRSTEPFEVAIVRLTPDLDPLSRAVTSLLEDQEMQAYGADLDEVERPDVLLLLDTSAGGASVWFCSPGAAASEQLAQSLLESMEPLASETDEASEDDVTRSMPCSSLHQGRASMAVVLVRLPAEAIGPGVEASQALATGIASYLGEHGREVRTRRDEAKFVWPAQGPITSHYGPDHALGIDIGQGAGPIRAATDGIVTFAGGDECCSYGYFVMIDSGSGVTTVYAHLSRISVRQGQAVSAGQSLGAVGCTGRCYGTHLHFETIKNGVRVNPLSLLP